MENNFVKKNFIVRAVRYELDSILEVRDIAVCQTEDNAKMIVDALEKSDWAVLFHFGTVEVEECEIQKKKEE